MSTIRFESPVPEVAALRFRPMPKGHRRISAEEGRAWLYRRRSVIVAVSPYGVMLVIAGLPIWKFWRGNVSLGETHLYGELLDIAVDAGLVTAEQAKAHREAAKSHGEAYDRAQLAQDAIYALKQLGLPVTKKLSAIAEGGAA